MFAELSGTCREGLISLAHRDAALPGLFSSTLNGHLSPLRSVSTALVHVEQPLTPALVRAEYKKVGLASVRLEYVCIAGAGGPVAGRDEIISTVSRAPCCDGSKKGSATAFLFGQPGVGTSTVAIEAAPTVDPHVSRRHPLSQAAWLLAEARRSARTVIRIVSEARNFGATTEFLDDEAAFALFRDRLADSRTLLVLDDALDAAHVAPLVRPPRTCGVIVTARNRLQSFARTGVNLSRCAVAARGSVELLTQGTAAPRPRHAGRRRPAQSWRNCAMTCR
jgi:hypothetical protein